MDDFLLILPTQFHGTTNPASGNWWLCEFKCWHLMEPDVIWWYFECQHNCSTWCKAIRAAVRRLVDVLNELLYVHFMISVVPLCHHKGLAKSVGLSMHTTFKAPCRNLAPSIWKAFFLRKFHTNKSKQQTHQGPKGDLSFVPQYHPLAASMMQVALQDPELQQKVLHVESHLLHLPNRCFIETTHISKMIYSKYESHKELRRHYQANEGCNKISRLTRLATWSFKCTSSDVSAFNRLVQRHDICTLGVVRCIERLLDKVHLLACYIHHTDCLLLHQMKILSHKHSFHWPLAITRLQGNCKGNLHEHGIQRAILSFRGRDDCVLGSSSSPTSISMRSSCLQIVRAESRGQRSTSKYHNVSSSIITLSTSCMTRKKSKVREVRSSLAWCTLSRSFSNSCKRDLRISSGLKSRDKQIARRKLHGTCKSVDTTSKSISRVPKFVFIIWNLQPIR